MELLYLTFIEEKEYQKYFEDICDNKVVLIVSNRYSSNQYDKWLDNKSKKPILMLGGYLDFFGDYYYFYNKEDKNSIKEISKIVEDFLIENEK